MKAYLSLRKILIFGPTFWLFVSFLDVCPGPIFAAKESPDTVIQRLSPHVEKLKKKDLVELAKAYSENGNPAAAIRVYTTALALNPKDAEVKTLIALEQVKMRKEKEAKVTLKEALEIDPLYKPAYHALINIYENQKNKYELRLLYQDMNEKIGESLEYVTKLCELSTLDAIYDLAFKYCKRGIELSDKEPNNWVYLGLAYKETDETEKGESTLKTVADRFPQSELSQTTYAEYLAEKKNYILAYKYNKQAVKFHPKSVRALVSLGSTALEIQKFQESLDSFRAACNIDKKILPSFRRAANVLRTTKNDEWLKKFEASIDKCG